MRRLGVRRRRLVAGRILVEPRVELLDLVVELAELRVQRCPVPTAALPVVQSQQRDVELLGLARQIVARARRSGVAAVAAPGERPARGVCGDGVLEPVRRLQQQRASERAHQRDGEQHERRAAPHCR